MALLDVTQILTDPDMVDSFTVKRRAETINSYGRTVIGEQIFTPVIGVVTAIGPSSLDRHEDYQSMTRSISVVTKFRLRGEVTGYQPDVIVWRGDNFVVKQIDPYPQFGPGFVQVECTSMDKTDLPLDAPAPGNYAFNQPANAVLLGVR